MRPSCPCCRTAHLGSTTVHDGGLELVLDLAGTRSGTFEILDDLHAGVIGNLAEDDVLAIEPRSNDGGDEELGTVATCLSASMLVSFAH